MTKHNKFKNIPELRFPEFKGDGEWEEKSVGDIYEFKTTNSLSREHLSYEDGIIKNIHYGDIHTKFETLFSLAKEEVPYIKSDSIVLKKLKKDSYCKEGDMIFADASEDMDDIGKSIEILDLNNEKLVSGLHTILARPKDKKLIVGFGGYLFKSEPVRKQIQREAQGAKVLGISATRLAKVKISFPKNSKEQKKIADFLSSLDEVITAHSDKLKVLKDHKKGLMQVLFPQEGEKVPKYRFKEFKDDGEWEESTIVKIKSILTDYVANGSFQSLRENLNVLDGEGYAFYVRLTDLRAGLGHPDQKYVDEDTYLFLNKSSLFGGELLMANIGANVGEVWQMPFVEKPATLAPNMIMIKFKASIDRRYIYQYLTSDIGLVSVSSVISGSGHPKINKTDLGQVKVFLPPTLLEQQKIADTLSSLDDLTTAQSEKIEQLQAHKKGLMQKLFPAINE